MSQLTPKELKNLDIDWYCSINGHPIHIASMGGPIPSPFNDRKTLRKIEDAVIELPNIADVSIIETIVRQEIAEGYEYIDELGLSDSIEKIFGVFPSFNYNKNWNIETRLYTFSFVDKARKGFYSYTRLRNSNKYALIAKPSVEFRKESEMISLTPLNLNVNAIDVPKYFVLERMDIDESQNGL